MHFIADENGNEQIIFQTTSSAVNQIDVTNAATGNSPEISATGDDTNISLKLTPKGSGQVLLDGNVGIESGTIDLKNSGSRSKINFIVSQVMLMHKHFKLHLTQQCI